MQPNQKPQCQIKVSQPAIRVNHGLPGKQPNGESPLKKFLLTGILACSLLGGGALAYKHYVSSGAEAVSAVAHNKAELIRHLVALHDDDFHFDKLKQGQHHNDDWVHKEESRNLKVDDHHLHAHEQAPSQTSVQIQDQAPEKMQHKDPYAGRSLQQEAQVVERSLAVAPEEKIIEQTESAEMLEAIARDQAEEDRLKAERSEVNSIQLANDVEAKQKAASESLRKHRESQKQSLQNPDINPDQAKLGFFTGVLAKCYIAGHDVHWIDSVGNLLHVKHHEPLTGNALAAREIINANPRTVVLIYEKGYEVYDLTGNLLETGNRE